VPTRSSYSYRQILKIAYPIFITLLAQNLIQVTDTAFLGHVGAVELGASAIAGIFYIVIFTLAFGFSTGAQILIGRRNGEQQYHKIGEICLHGTLFLILIALAMFLLVKFCARPALAVMLSSDAVLEASVTYLDWRILGIFFACINLSFRAFFVGTTNTKILSINALIMAGTNVVFDYALIFGHWGFPAMGIAGAGLASVIAEASSTVFYLCYTFVAVELKKYGFSVIRFKGWSVIQNILNVSLSLMFQYLISLATWFVFFLAIEKMGEQSLAAANIVRSIYMLFALPVFALSTTTSTLVSNTIGAGKSQEVLPLIWKIIKAALVISLIFSLLLLLFPHPLLSIYTADPDLIAICRSSLLVVSAALSIVAVGNIFFSSVSGTGNTRKALKIEIITVLFYLSYLYLLVQVLHASLPLCWTSEALYFGVLFIFSYRYLQSGKWKNRQI